MNRDTIREILSLSLNAPSGDNSQPWKFKISGNKVDIYLDPLADNPLLNFNLRGTLIAHGALLENILLASSEINIKCVVKTYEDYLDSSKLFTVIFSDEEKPPDPLASSIALRQTNRTKFKKDKLEKGTIALYKGYSNHTVRVRAVDSDQKLRLLSKNLSVAEYVILRNKKLHSILFKDLVWTKKEERKKKHGLFVDTLELAPPAKVVMKIAEDWSRMKVLQSIGLSKLVSIENSRTYLSSGAFIALVVKDLDINFIEAGRIMEKIWLSSTSNEIGVQPLNGLIFLGMNKDKLDEILSPQDKALVQKSIQSINSVFRVKQDEIIATIVRVGHAKNKPSATSSKVSLEEVLIR